MSELCSRLSQICKFESIVLATADDFLVRAVQKNCLQESAWYFPIHFGSTHMLKLRSVRTLNIHQRSISVDDSVGDQVAHLHAP